MFKQLRILVIGFLALSMSACGFEIVDTGNRGIETTYGEVKGEPLPEGLHFYNPVTSNITELNVQERKWESSATAYTKDVQEANLVFTVNYYPDPMFIHTLYKDVGVDWANKLLPQVVVDSLKTTIGKWEADKLIGEREKARNEAKELIRAALKSKHIIVVDFAINNLNYTDVYEKSVEAKQVAIQRAIEEENRTVQINEQAKQRVLTATSQATSIKIRANALKANPALVEWEAVKKWDGVLPTQMLGQAPMPFLNVGGK